MKRIIVSVTNDLVTDQRVNKTCLTLSRAGYDVFLVGRKLKHSLPLENKPFRMHRMSLLFTKGPFFYAEYNLRLFFFLLFKKTDILFSNDLDTLLPNYLVSRLKAKKLVYDTHEYFCYVPELVNRPGTQKIWLAIERFVFPKLKWVMTVNESIAKLYEGHYGIEPVVVRNVPMRKAFEGIPLKSRKELGLPEDKHIVLLQGAGININRGAEEALQAMKFMENTLFLVIGGGDVLHKLKSMVEELKLQDKVVFKPKMPFKEMIAYTRCADVGLTLDKADNPNYEFSLPNKLFDYIHAGITVLASPLVEIKKVYHKYPFGELVENHDPEHIADKLKSMLEDKAAQAEWRENIRKAALEYNWEKEEGKILELFKKM